MKRIITCCDGTWNRPGQKDQGVVTMTNVQKLAHLVCSSDPAGTTQLSHYQPGVGTSGNWLQRLAGGVGGAGLDQNIIDAYRFIALNYEEGDLNYLFGFSRGAYTARSLGGFIVNCGILKKEHIHRLGEAFALYRDRDPESHPNSQAALVFKAKYSHEPAIHFIGVWDTVGDLGIPLQIFQWLDGKKYRFHDTQLASIVRYAYHAMAIHEHRKLFNATLWQLSANGKAKLRPQTLEQVWFPGAHSNVGGGYRDTALSDATLEWMIGKAEGAGLAFNKPLPADIKPDIPTGLIRNSLSIWWRLTQRFVTFYRTIFIQDDTFIGQAVQTPVYQRTDLPVNLPPLAPLVHRLLPGEELVMAVPATTAYSFEGLSVLAGETYVFTCDGSQRWNDSWISTSPKGYFNPLASLFGMRVKGQACFCLCGTYECRDELAFGIGTGAQQVTSSAGILSFFANDTQGFYFNNKGQVNLSIKRI
ncbi:DUF2235 domain-containing protein [Mucilaginibacter sp.]|uniref:DUF2235 domain-containing protein n=1 Tax=Mucilaginibacter sp. TaxID=1882438 RepID=UPI003D100950